MKKKWFEGSGIIKCNLQELKLAIENPGKFYEGVVSFMPGLTSVKLLEQGKDFVIIETNEGLMKRTNIRKTILPDGVVIEFDEEYQAGRMVTANSHFLEEFKATKEGLNHRTEISDVTAPGILGFFYRSFGSKSIGNAILKSHKTYLESSRN